MRAENMIFLFQYRAATIRIKVHILTDFFSQNLSTTTRKGLGTKLFKPILLLHARNTRTSIMTITLGGGVNIN